MDSWQEEGSQKNLSLNLRTSGVKRETRSEQISVQIRIMGKQAHYPYLLDYGSPFWSPYPISRKISGTIGTQ